MNAKKMIVAVAVFSAAGAALADDTYPYVDHGKFVSTRARAEVQAEMNPAVATNLPARNTEYVEFTNVGSTRTRAEVQAELAKDFADGHYAGNRNQEFVEFSNFASSRTRDEVRSEAIQAAKSKTQARTGG